MSIIDRVKQVAVIAFVIGVIAWFVTHPGQAAAIVNAIIDFGGTAIEAVISFFTNIFANL